MTPMESASSLAIVENASTEPHPVLEEGNTCWRLAQADRAAVLYDGAEYFAALRSSMLAAERSIFILGWELHSRMRLEGTHRPRDGAPAEIGRFMRWLLRHRPKLEIRILLWNHPVVYSVQRELFPLRIFGRRKPRRIEIVLDSRLPLGAAHHEKLVVIDDSVAFCGGMDLTVRRWDTCSHHPAEPRRRYRSRTPYAPTHDVQMVVAGDVAAVLGTRARDRWARAGGAVCPDVAPHGDPWPREVVPDFERVPVGIVRTLGALADGTEEIREVERCTAAALAGAQRLVYIENQYVTATAASETLRDRMRAEPSLQALVVTTREPGGWLEARTMGVGRQRFMRAFDEEELARRIRFVAPIVHCPALRSLDAPDALSVHVHAKVLIVDDTFLRIGSSNLNNRSMGFDTECDLAIEAESAEHRAAIARVRNRLIAEHWGSDPEAVARATERDDVAGALEELPRRPVHTTARGLRALPVTPLRRAARAPATRSVVPIDREDVPSETAWVVQLGDPERVVSAEQLIAQTVGVADPSILRRVASVLVLVAVVALGLFAASAAGLGLDDVRGLGSRLLATIESLGQHPWGVPSVVAIFVVGSLIAVPILGMIGATVLALGPLLGFVCSTVGVLLAAAATFGTGRLLGRDAFRRWMGERLTKLEEKLSRHGVLAVALVRKVPIAPFTIVNMLIGAIGFRFRDFMFGTALGMVPGIAAFSFLSDRVIDAWREPTTTNVLLIGAAVLVWLGVVLGVQQFVNRRARS
jgi:phospholipase D1/2